MNDKFSNNTCILHLFFKYMSTHLGSSECLALT